MKPISLPSRLCHSIQSWERVTRSQLDFMVHRFEKDPAYQFIDTKYDLIQQTNVTKTDPVRGRNTIYGWIQGRGLEALAGHAQWLASGNHPDDTKSVSRIKTDIRLLINRLDQRIAEQKCNLTFMMHEDGSKPALFGVERVAENCHFTDLFYSKGLAAAAALLEDSEQFERAKVLFDRVCDDILTDQFVSDQASLDPKNPVKPVPGRHGHGPRMIALGGLSLMLQITGDTRYCEIGFEMIEHIFKHYVHHSNRHDAISSLAQQLQVGDMWEFIDDKSEPWLEAGRVLRCDPGHAIEFTGLAMKFLHHCEQRNLLNSSQTTSAQQWRHTLCHMLQHHVQLGFSADGIGIYKAIDLIQRTPLHSDMPWWPLPETIRAAAFARRYCPAEEVDCYDAIMLKCTDAFMTHYVQPSQYHLAFQTLDSKDKPVSRIPATPDLDPCYHTGLSLIDAIQLLRQT